MIKLFFLLNIKNYNNFIYQLILKKVHNKILPTFENVFFDSPVYFEE